MTDFTLVTNVRLLQSLVNLNPFLACIQKLMDRTTHYNFLFFDRHNTEEKICLTTSVTS